LYSKATTNFVVKFCHLHSSVKEEEEFLFSGKKSHCDLDRRLDDLKGREERNM